MKQQHILKSKFFIPFSPNVNIIYIFHFSHLVAYYFTNGREFVGLLV